VFGWDFTTRFTAWKLKCKPKSYHSSRDSRKAADFCSAKWKLGRPLIPLRCIQPKSGKLPTMPPISQNWPVCFLLFSFAILSYSFFPTTDTRKKRGLARVPIAGLFWQTPAARQSGIEYSHLAALIPLLEYPRRRPGAKLQPPACSRLHCSVRRTTSLQEQRPTPEIYFSAFSHGSMSLPRS
jgi:hypothetical protein